ncbi:MAG: C25 family cysteine peptidase [Candidatus Krumholzibacteria bacterium]|nr:C25 family cysteine peptidase [Candidatus Krumholzibacteria bacterium]
MNRLSARVSLATMLAVAMLAHVAVASDLSFRVPVPGDVSVTSAPGGDRVAVTADGWQVSREPGYPELPYRIVNVLLPPGEAVASVSFRSGTTRVVRSGVSPVVAGAHTTSQGLEADAPAAVLPASGEARGRFLGSGWLHGYAVASIAIYPFEVVDNTLLGVDEVAFTVHTRAAEDRPVTRERRRDALDESVRERLRAMVLNAGQVSSYASAGEVVPEPTGGFLPSIFPSLEGSAVDYVIVTNDSLAATFQTLADWKTEKGVPTVVRTTEWIAANYLNGADMAETVRNFAIDAYAKWGISYLLLAGDSDQVPVRTAFSVFYDGGRMLPVDMYFGCLDGDWNADHDAIFGEFGQDNADLYAEVYTGRLPARSNAEAAVMIGKVMEYEKPSQTSYAAKSLMLAEVLFPSNYHPGDPISLDGASITEFLRLSYFTDPALAVTRLYENHPAYPGVLPETRQVSVDSINAGYNHVIHIGHGFRFNMSVGDASIVNADADAFTNGTRLSNFNLLNCTACAYTYESLAEHLLRNPNGGAVSVVGSNESAFPTTASSYQGEFYRLLLMQNVVHQGELFARSREPRTGFALASDGSDRWTHFVYTNLAEPEMPLWTRAVAPLTASFPASVPKGTSLVTVTVTSNATPVEGAVVCLSKDGDDYEVGTTDVSGQVTLSFRAESAGSIKVVATGRNYKRYDGAITVTGTGPYVTLASMVIDDDNLSGTSGNGNGVIEAGERVDLQLAFKNTGTSSTTGTLTVRLRSNDAGVTINDSTASLVTLAAGATATATGGVRVTFNSALPDEYAAPFVVVVRVNGVETWRDEFKKEVHLGSLALVRLRIDDSASGNGNGVVEAGEQFNLYYRAKNFGTGTYPGGSVTISDLDAGFTIIDGTDSFGAIAPQAEAENVGGLTLIEPSVASEHRLRILVTDTYGRAYADTVELRAPLPPSALVVDPGLGPDRLQVSWTASTSLDAVRYNLYRSTSALGPFAQSNVDPVAHTFFLNTGLSSTTKYYFKATAIDASGNESAQSAAFSGSTNPSQVIGFPIGMAAETTSSPAVGDIDGDGLPEIVVGDNRVYAFHGDGDEVVDGDNSPVTWGVLSDQGDNFVGHVALAQLDGLPGLEIVASSRETKQVYVFRHTGEVLAGWPRTVENFIRAGAAVGDVDGDGLPREVVAIDELGVVYVWRADGSEYLDGDANPVTQGVFKRLTGCTFQYSTPALADINSDSRDEIIVGTQGNELHVLDLYGNNLPGFPLALADDISGSPAVGDVDGNGTLEIVINVRNGNIRAIRNNGTELWSRFTANGLFFAPSPALADVDGDGKLETFVPAASGKLYCFSFTGTDRPGFPVNYSTLTYTESSPVIADVDGDGLLDVVIGSEEQSIWGWDRNGVVLDGFPLKTQDSMRGVPQLADVDLDGDTDLVAAGWDKNVYVWDFSGSWDDNAAPWPRFHANVHNNGRTGFTLPTPVGGASFRYAALGGGMELVWTVPLSASGGLFNVSRAELKDDVPGPYRREAGAVGLSMDGEVRVVDRGVEMGSRYVYRLEGEGGVVNETLAVLVPVTIAKLGQNYPNPFNPVTTIEYWVPGGIRNAVSLVIYDVRGARVRTLVDGEKAAGRYAAQWDGRNDAGAPVGSGVYFYRMSAGSFQDARRMVLLK